jgi:hypothetical protein
MHPVIISSYSVRVFCLSDLHMDYEGNRDWLREACKDLDSSTYNVFVCCGDISHEISILSETLRLLKSCYDEVRNDMFNVLFCVTLALGLFYTWKS